MSHNAIDDGGQPLTRELLLEQPYRVPVQGGRERVLTGWPKQALFAKAASMKPAPQFLVQKWVDSYNSANGTDVKVLFLPVAHPQLNPIETMWSLIKQFVRQHNRLYDMHAIWRLAAERRDSLDAAAWAALYGHMRKYAIDQWEADELLLKQEETDAEDVEA